MNTHNSICVYGYVDVDMLLLSWLLLDMIAVVALILITVYHMSCQKHVYIEYSRIVYKTSVLWAHCIAAYGG